jgi:hypothetical protein
MHFFKRVISLEINKIMSRFAIPQTLVKASQLALRTGLERLAHVRSKLTCGQVFLLRAMAPMTECIPTPVIVPR